MHPIEVEKALKNAVLLLDTREQDTPALRNRLQLTELPHKREKLDFGDYSITTMLDEDSEFSLKDVVSIERKMSLDELCNCYCQNRERFIKEFERAKEKNAKIYMLIENATWENAYNGKYKSKMSSPALVASILAWLARYNCQIIFCKAETSGKIIGDILRRELKERLENA